MTTSILLPLSDDRIRDETRIAHAITAGESRYHKRMLRIILACAGEYGMGLSVIGWSLHIYGGDLAQVAFYSGILIAVCGPIWTVLLAMWLEEN